MNDLVMFEEEKLDKVANMNRYCQVKLTLLQLVSEEEQS